MTYIVELICSSNNCFCRIEFEIVEREDDREFQYKIRIVSHSGIDEVYGDAIAYCAEYQHFCTILQYIEYKNERYVPDTTRLYLFPGIEPVLKHIEDSMQFYIRTDTFTRSIIVHPLDTLPFMDIDGVFQYEYVVIYREDEQGKWRTCKKPVTVYQVNDEYKAIWDKKSKKFYAIQNAVTFLTPVRSNPGEMVAI